MQSRGLRRLRWIASWEIFVRVADLEEETEEDRISANIISAEHSQL